eukprot:763109-Hanusia_phi.AAC.3
MSDAVELDARQEQRVAGVRSSALQQPPSNFYQEAVLFNNLCRTSIRKQCSSTTSVELLSEERSKVESEKAPRMLQGSQPETSTLAGLLLGCEWSDAMEIRNELQCPCLHLKR